jgi:hypothetical protein
LAKRPLPGKCVYCLQDPVERDWDHVFPKSWYPAPSPENQYKWQVPSCVPCNHALGKIENDPLRRIGLSLDPNHPASSSIALKAVRAHTPEAGKDERDRSIRAALRKGVLDNALEAAAAPEHAVYPGMGERWGRPREEHLAVRISADDFHRFTEKIVRGVFFVVDQKLVEPPFAIESFALDPSLSGPIRELIERFAETYARVPGIIVRRAVTEDGISSLFEIEFWGQLKRYATVRPENLILKRAYERYPT